MENSPEGLAFHARSDFRSFTFRVWMLLVVSVHIVVDFLFIAAYVWSQRFTTQAIIWLGEQPGMSQVKRQIIEFMFDGATLTLLAVFTARDLYLTALRIWRHR